MTSLISLFLFPCQAFPDNAAGREIASLPARCLNQGCSWTGSIKEYEVKQRVELLPWHGRYRFLPECPFTALSVLINLRDRVIWHIICIPGSWCSLKDLNFHITLQRGTAVSSETNRKWNLTGGWKVPASPHLSTKAQWKVPEWNKPIELSVTATTRVTDH